MSTIAGILYFDRRPVPDADRLILANVRAHRNGDAIALIGAPGLLMGQAPSRFEAPEARSPVQLASGAACVWDGRLDTPPPASPPSSATIALERYHARGVPGLGELIGDWSLALWDPRSSSIVLASDYAGIRPLYYTHRDGRVCWSSSLSLLAQWTAADRLDDEFTARFLMSRTVPGRSPYSGICPIPPGHALRFSAAGCTDEQFWRLPIGRQTILRDDREYEEGLYERFEEAVRVRLRGTPVCAELSGGLDSSSVVAMSSRLLAPANPCGFSYTHPGCRDEPYIQAVEETCGLVSDRLNLPDYPLVSAGQTGGAVPAWWEPKFAEVARRMELLGSGTLLTGQLGDFIMGNLGDDSEQVAGYLEQRRFGEALREAYAWTQPTRMPVYSILWRALRTTWFSYTAPALANGGNLVVGPFTLAHSLTPRMQSLISEAEEREFQNAEWRLASPGLRRRFRMLAATLEARILQTPEPLRHLSWTHPYAHRPLLEYMLTIPPSQVCRPTEPRRLMRRTFARFLPEKIVRRITKAGYSVSFRQALLPLAAALLQEPDRILIVEAGYVEREGLLERLRRFSQGLDCNEMQLRQILLFEFWLKNREGATGNYFLDGTTNSTVTP